MDGILQLDNFELLELLGRGGMSNVWKARQISLDRMVAIKFLTSSLATDPADVAQFHTEAMATARLKHPGIVQVYDANLSDGMYYFVMEFIDGYTVGEWVRRKGQIPESDVLVLTECIATALDYAWTQFGMIHCDIKPDNVMIDADGSVKITDLGLVRTLATLSTGPSDEVMGTPAYMSPEQISGDPMLDCRTDIYSLGAMLYRLLTGHLLFENETEERQMVLQIEGSVPHPTTYCPRLSPALCRMIAKMLVKDRRFRYADWTAVKADLARVKKRLPIKSAPKQALSTMQGGTQRFRVPAPKQPVATQDWVVNTDNAGRRARRPWFFFALLLGLAPLWG